MEPVGRLILPPLSVHGSAETRVSGSIESTGEPSVQVRPYRCCGMYKNRKAPSIWRKMEKSIYTIFKKGRRKKTPLVIVLPFIIAS